MCQFLARRGMTGDEKEAWTFDVKRLAVFVSCNAFYIAPLLSWWFGLLNGLPQKLFGDGVSDLVRASTMIVADQVST